VLVALLRLNFSLVYPPRKNGRPLLFELGHQWIGSPRKSNCGTTLKIAQTTLPNLTKIGRFPNFPENRVVEDVLMMRKIQHSSQMARIDSKRKTADHCC
jgi:hypothetical protein